MNEVVCLVLGYRSQTFYQFCGTYADAYEYDTADGFYWFAPTHMVAETDNRGLVRAYMLIDVMPVVSVAGGEGTIEDVGILASIGWDTQTFTMQGHVVYLLSLLAALMLVIFTSG